MDVIQFAILGLGAGAIYALLAQGLVAIYRGSGVLNFAHGSIAMVAAFLFAQLRDDGGWGLVPAFAVAIVVAILIGAAIQVLIMRPLSGASSLSRVIATLGVLLTLQAAALQIWGTQVVYIDSELPDSVLEIGDVTVGVDRLLLVGIAATLTALLWAGYRFTAVGLATRGVAENRRAGAALGWSPNLLATVNWSIGAGFAGLAGVLIAPITGIQVEAMTLLVVPALAAALIGGFTSFPLTLLGALGLGIAQSETARFVEQQGAADTLPLVVIVVVLVLRGRGLPSRGGVAERVAALGTGAVRARIVVPLAGVVALLTLLVFPDSLVGALIVSFAVGTLMLSIVVLTGYTGQLSLAQFALGGIAAFVAAKLVATQGFSFLPALIAGVLAAALVGVVFGLPALRTRGVNLAVVTLGLGLSVQAMVFNNATYTGGQDGTPVGPQSLLGIDVNAVQHPDRYAVLALLAFVVCALAVTRVRRGRVGRRLIAVRTNERAAAALGVSVVGTKLYAFGLAAAIAGLGGTILAFKDQTVLYDQFGPIDSILSVAYAVVGSVGYIAGPLFGSTLYHGGVGSWLFNSIFSQNVEDYLPLIGGIAVIVFLLRDPNGMASAHKVLVDWVLRRVGASEPAAPPRVPQAEAPPPEIKTVAPATLEISDLIVRFGGVTAVDGASLTVRPGEVMGLIGPNGAGKTTLIDAVTGFVRTAAGDTRLNGESIGAWPVHKRARAGISRSFQSLELFEDITVRENLRAASDSRDRRAYLTNLVASGNRPLPPAALAAIREFGLEQDLDKRPEEMPYGRRRLIAVARAVAVEPSILLLDEPAAGLDATEAEELAELVRSLAERWGIGILLVEHNMAFVMSVCDRVTVLEFGRQIAQGTRDEVRDDPAVIAAYLGSPDGDAPMAAEPAPLQRLGASEGGGR